MDVHKPTSPYTDNFSRKKTTKHELLPIVKLGENKTYYPHLEVPCSGIVVKAQHLLSKDGRGTNRRFDEIDSTDGIHQFLKYGGPVILSSIMPDRTIDGLDIATYSNLINRLGFDYYFTPDGTTYLGEEEDSFQEIDRILNQTKDLLDACETSIPIGLVKGCNIQQIGYHIDKLLEMNINQYVFHLSDFNRGSKTIMNTARSFASYIRKRVPYLMIYGIGSRQQFMRFKFADCFATQSHFVRTFYGYKFATTKWRRQKKLSITRETIMDNLKGIYKFVEIIEEQQDLTRWLDIDCIASPQKTGASSQCLSYCLEKNGVI